MHTLGLCKSARYTRGKPKELDYMQTPCFTGMVVPKKPFNELYRDLATPALRSSTFEKMSNDNDLSIVTHSKTKSQNNRDPPRRQASLMQQFLNPRILPMLSSVAIASLSLSG